MTRSRIHGPTARKVVAVAMLSVLASSLVAPAPAHARRKVIKGRFTAAATPFPQPWEAVPGTHGCASGTEGQHKVTRFVTAPFGGFLEVDLAGFQGDWDLYLVDSEGTTIAESYDPLAFDDGPEGIYYYLERGEEVGLVACNWAGGPQAEVTYRLKAAPAWPRPSTNKITHEDLVQYRLPSTATTQNEALCMSGYYGCYSMAVWGGDRSVSVDLQDATGADIAFTLHQFAWGRGMIYDRNYCGSTNGPIEIEPRIDTLSIYIFSGPCEGSSEVVMPTVGRIRAEFRG